MKISCICDRQSPRGKCLAPSQNSLQEALVCAVDGCVSQIRAWVGTGNRARGRARVGVPSEVIGRAVVIAPGEVRTSARVGTG